MFYINIITMKANTYLFGYGSLICSKSRGVTSPELRNRPAIPVTVKGVERTWSKRCARGMTAMGVRFREQARCAGVLVPLASEEELALFDEREQGYVRHRIPLADVQKVPFLPTKEYHEHSDFLDTLQNLQEDSGSDMDFSDMDDDGNSTVTSKQHAQHDDESLDIWVYVPQKTRAPSMEYPIVQSYVDTIMRGCMDVGGEPFVAEFLNTTAGWHPEEWQDQHYADDDTIDQVWVDDRSDPIYPRGEPQHFRKHGPTYDRLIEHYRSDDFEIRIGKD